MNPISYKNPLVIQVGASTVRVYEIAPCGGSIRVEGWITAPTKDVGFEASRTLGVHLGRKSVGGYCDARTETEAVNFPFSFDVELSYVAPHYRRETTEEAVVRVTKSLRRARVHFAKQSQTVAV